jgi:hypothetical protein
VEGEWEELAGDLLTTSKRNFKKEQKMIAIISQKEPKEQNGKNSKTAGGSLACLL